MKWWISLCFSAKLLAQTLTYNVDFTPIPGSTFTNLYTSEVNPPNAITVTSDGLTAYIATGNGTVYKMTGLIPGSPVVITPVVTNTGEDYRGIALSSDELSLYVTSNPHIFNIALPSGPPTQLAQTNNPNGYFGIAVADSSTAYVAAGGGNSEDQVYRIDLTDNVAPVAISTTPRFYYGVTLSQSGPLLVYASTSINNGTVYEFSTPGPSAGTQIVSTPNSYGTLSSDGTTLYMTLTPGSDVYSALIPGVGMQSPAEPVVLPVPPFIGQGPDGILVGATTYTHSSLLSLILRIANNPTVSQISTSGIKGSALILADYLNAVAPSQTIQLFTALQGETLTQALLDATPTRNAFASYAAQLATLIVDSSTADHVRNVRFHKKEETLCALQPYSLWLEPVGDYIKQKKQAQNPSFHATVAGGILGFDYNGLNKSLVGTSVAYTQTHLHENSHSGHANVKQGFWTLYGSTSKGPFYADFSFTGSYYHTYNLRNLSFPGFQGHAVSATHGWQISPHVEFGYDRYTKSNGCVDWFGIVPFLMGDAIYSWEHSFKEHGAAGLNMGQKGKTCSLIQIEVGARFHQTVKTLSWKINIVEKTSYAYRKLFGTGKMTSFLVGESATFQTEMLGTAQNLAVGELMLQWIPLTPSWPYLYLSVQGEYGSEYLSLQGQATFGKDF